MPDTTKIIGIYGGFHSEGGIGNDRLHLKVDGKDMEYHASAIECIIKMPRLRLGNKVEITLNKEGWVLDYKNLGSDSGIKKYLILLGLSIIAMIWLNSIVLGFIRNLEVLIEAIK